LNGIIKIRDVRTYVLEAALSEPFAYSQAWYERRGACLVEIVGEDGFAVFRARRPATGDAPEPK